MTLIVLLLGKAFFMKYILFVLIFLVFSSGLTQAQDAQRTQPYEANNAAQSNIEVINRDRNGYNYNLSDKEFIRTESNSAITAGSIATKEMDARAQNNMGSTRATSNNNLGSGLDLGNRGMR
jgi:hypothetical protein